MKKYRIELECEVDYKGDVLFAIPNDGHWVYGFGDYVKQHGTEIKEPVTYKIGDRFRHDAFGRFVLAHIASYHVGLINLESGRRWVKASLVNSPNEITEDEFAEICGGDPDDFTKIEDDK